MIDAYCNAVYTSPGTTAAVLMLITLSPLWLFMVLCFLDYYLNLIKQRINANSKLLLVYITMDLITLRGMTNCEQESAK